MFFRENPASVVVRWQRIVVVTMLQAVIAAARRGLIDLGSAP
jgi:hypothetical protein